MNDQLLTPLEVAQLLRLDVDDEVQARRRLYEMTRRRAARRLRAVRVGRQMRFWLSEVLTYAGKDPSPPE